MKRLVRIRVVQFFLFEREELQIDEITSIFGPNASGKSSILDAVQIGMFGGNSQMVALNAQADEEQRTTRSLKAYCLGQYGESPEDRARDNATTYISLIWEDTETHEPLTMGVCISASADREKHEVLGRYLLPGIELHMRDHLEIVNGEERPREWSTFRHQLIERARATGEEILFNDARRYINAALLALRGSGNAPHSESFTRAFRFALRMRFDKSVDQIVRYDVLESRPTNIKQFREITESFKRLAELVAQVETKLADGRSVESDLNKAAEESRRTATWHAMGRMAAVEVANQSYHDAIESCERLEEKLAEKTSALRTLEDQINQATEQSMHYRLAKESHASHKDYGALQAESDAARQRGEYRSKLLKTDLGLFRKKLSQAIQSVYLASFANEASASLALLDRMIESQEKPNKSAMEAHFRPALKVAEQAYNSLLTQTSQLKTQLKPAQDRLTDARFALARAEKGRARLSDNVQRLMSELKDHGLNPVPVCDLIKITDSDWQSTLESFLGINLQALLVPENEESEAFRIYRGMTGPRAVYGAKLARESRQELGRPVNPGSVAELIEGSHPAAVAFIRRMLADIRQASTDNDALAGKRTLTQDGMLVSGGSIERLQPVPPQKFMIGAGSDIHRVALEREVKEMAAEVQGIESNLVAIESLQEALRLFSAEELVMQGVYNSLEEIERSAQEEARKSALLTEQADSDYLTISNLEKEWDEKALALRNAWGDLKEKYGGDTSTLTTLKHEESKAKARVETAVEEADKAKSHAEYDHEFWLTQWDRMLEMFDGKPGELVSHSDVQRDRAENRMREAVSRGMRELWSFIGKYHEQVPTDTTHDWRQALTWLGDLLERLDKTELAEYREQMDAAYRTSQETFRNDVAIALYNNMEWLGETMDRLNAVLRSCPTFSNGERYRFKRSVRPHLDSLHRFIKDAATLGPTQDLFDGAGDIPEAFRELLDDKVAAGSNRMSNPLDDYREFFDFDIEILREHPITKEAKVVGHLSKRLGPGSGGEHRAPLYVIAGAALASAYRLDRGNRDGLRLMLLDEAFNKMDMTNIIATMRYLEDLGLQVLMASPGENQGIVSAFLHRYYEIMRDSETNTVRFEGHSVSEEIRKMFRSDLPEFNPGLVEQEITAMRSQLGADLTSAAVIN